MDVLGAVKGGFLPNNIKRAGTSEHGVYFKELRFVVCRSTRTVLPLLSFQSSMNNMVLMGSSF